MQTLRQVLTIPNAGTASPVFGDARALAQAAAITIIAPAALTGVCTVRIADGAGNFRIAQSPPGTDIAIAAAKAVVLPPVALNDFRIESTLAEGAARDFVVLVQSYR